MVRLMGYDTETLRERIVAIEARLSTHGTILSNLKQSSARHSTLLTAIDEHKAIAHLDKISARVAELNRKVQLEILKSIVLSEVSRIYPDSFRPLMSAMDMSDEWWSDGEDLTIKEWTNRISELHYA